ncbi:hypothetical protein P775_21385 [Puniceibacterium antarcticum]|uniref:Uncharacterized protein n=1 Tax=Puniceibacterium antarcticum TaxID=1206336 RepID=A0A2G8R9A8_9RHOB|nr:hypothetical protein [Puniceibacterium antarcticum]PIL18124.1 hypothetical protein P775_21385 [Puniceibacterium antarcticum]
MSNLQDRSESVGNSSALRKRYETSRASIESFRRIEAGQSGAMVYAALAYGDVLESSSGFRTMSHLAKLFCIAALFVIPNLLVIHVLL